MTELAAAGGIFLGCLARALFPFFKKQHQAAERGKDLKWQARYAWTIAFVILVSFIATTMLVPSFEIPATHVFPIAFTTGWAAQDIINMLIS